MRNMEKCVLVFQIVLLRSKTLPYFLKTLYWVDIKNIGRYKYNFSFNNINIVNINNNTFLYNQIILTFIVLSSLGMFYVFCEKFNVYSSSKIKDYWLEYSKVWFYYFIGIFIILMIAYLISSSQNYEKCKYISDKINAKI